MMIAELDQLERKIQEATKLLTQLREEKRTLAVENREFKERIRALESTAGKQRAADLQPKIHALEGERATLLDERRVMVRRVEEMLVKLSVLEKGIHA